MKYDDDQYISVQSTYKLKNLHWHEFEDLACRVDDTISTGMMFCYSDNNLTMYNVKLTLNIHSIFHNV